MSSLELLKGQVKEILSHPDYDDNAVTAVEAYVKILGEILTSAKITRTDDSQHGGGDAGGSSHTDVGREPPATGGVVGASIIEEQSLTGDALREIVEWHGQICAVVANWIASLEKQRGESREKAKALKSYISVEFGDIPKLLRRKG